MYENFHKQFSNAIESIHSGSKGILESFSEFCLISRLSFQQVLRFDREREEKIIQMQRASKNPKGYAEALSVLVNALEYQTGDFLGEWAGLNNALDHRSGQVFTPYYVSKMIAQSSVGNLKRQEIPLSINEPTCGAGSMVIAIFDVLRNLNFSPRDFYIIAQDIDIHCVNMAYIQCTLLDIPAVVLHGDSLTDEIYAKFPTFSYSRNYLMKSR